MTAIRLLSELLERSAARAPDGIALVDRGANITYRELDARANQLAHLLDRLGVRRGDRVGVHLTKSADAVVALYGAMKAGAAYVPLDARSPAARLALIAADCGLEVVISQERLAATWAELVDLDAPLRHVIALDLSDADTVRPVRGVTVHTAGEVSLGDPSAPPGRSLIDQDLAYILYTSGSTGAPKGVMLTHRNAMAFVDWAVETFSVDHSDVLSSHAPFHFDLSIFDLFAAAHASASLVLIPPATAMFPAEAARCIREHGITVWYSVPSILASMVEYDAIKPHDLPTLRAVLFAGEVFPPRYLSELMTRLPHVAFANLYGPTETNVCTAHLVRTPPAPDGPDLPIGRVITNDEVVVVDEERNEVGDGEVGELYVRGATVMRGYWGDPERTAQRLVPDWRPGACGDVLYRTGDLVRADADGTLHFLGRRDNQVKSRGYRIELGEVENALTAHPHVVAAVVIAVPDTLVTNRLHAVCATNRPTTAGDLASFCATRVPRYMVPESFDIRDELPRTSTGKIDRRQLSEELTSTSTSPRSSRPGVHVGSHT